MINRIKWGIRSPRMMPQSAAIIGTALLTLHSGCGNHAPAYHQQIEYIGDNKLLITTSMIEPIGDGGNAVRISLECHAEKTSDGAIFVIDQRSRRRAYQTLEALTSSEMQKIKALGQVRGN